ncbi:MAG: Rne/Rng family ribonuclease, partial [Motiliproteus sp.]|nr:Rne/Rng family ribonuclease [Motiliproteus sp.]
MAEELLINFAPMETRVALIENGMLQEVYIERVDKKGIVGNIYKGKVARVLPGMQAAFVDIGLERAAFIHAADLQPSNHNGEERSNSEPSISSMLREGQSLVVQVTKDPIGTKGARLTTNLSIPSRFLVLMPGTEHIGISQRIESEEERERLKQVVNDHFEANPDSSVSDGFILRTVSEGAPDHAIQSDIKFLQRLWCKIQERMKKSKAPSVIYEDLPLHMRALRDMANPGIERVRVDSRETFQKATDFVSSLVPEMADRLEYYPGERPIFDLYNVEDEIQKALGRKVELKSGGYLIFDQTEAMTTVDINTGAYVGHRTLEETIFKTNLEAATAIGRQLRLRNLGGIIIID